MKRIIFDVPKWHVYLHRSARQIRMAEQEDGPRIRFEDEVFERLYTGDPEPLADENKSSELRTWAERIHAACDQLPAFARLAQECRGDADAAASATEEVVGRLGAHLEEEPEKVPGPILRRVLGEAFQQASSSVERQRDDAEAFSGVSWGLGPGQAGASVGARARGLAARLKQDQRLRRIAELAGRFKRIAIAKQRSKVKHGHDEIADVELGADLARLLPSELGRLLHPKRRLALLRDLGERRCLQYQLSGAEPLGKGPLVLALDKSGSMEGEKDIWATAVALALLEVAQRQRRAFALLAFESLVRFEVVVDPGAALPEEALLVGCGGGTDIGAVVARGLQLIGERPGKLKKADLVIITDGWADTDGAPALRAQAAALGVTTLGVAIGVGTETLASWCDQAVSVERLDAVNEETSNQIFTL